MKNQRDEYGNPNQPKAIQLNGQTVTGVRKNNQGDIEAFQLANGTILSYAEALQAVQGGNAQGLIAQQGNQGQTVIRSAPDAFKENNLDWLPEFS